MRFGLAFDKAAADNDVRVIVVAVAGKHFSSSRGPMGAADDYWLQNVAISTSLRFGQPGIEASGLRGACRRYVEGAGRASPPADSLLPSRREDGDEGRIGYRS